MSLTSLLILAITAVSTVVFLAGIGLLDRRGELSSVRRQSDKAAMQAAMNEALAGPLAEFQRVQRQLDVLTMQLAEARLAQAQMRAMLETSGQYSLPAKVTPDFNVPDIAGLFLMKDVMNLPERRKQRTQPAPLALGNYKIA